MKKILLVMLFVLVSCSSQHGSSLEDAFKEDCLSHGHGWMQMSEMHTGKVTGPPCYGCMPNQKNHICSQLEYDDFLTKMQGDISYEGGP